jgi:hypothetical protein
MEKPTPTPQFENEKQAELTPLVNSVQAKPGAGSLEYELLRPTPKARHHKKFQILITHRSLAINETEHQLPRASNPPTAGPDIFEILDDSVLYYTQENVKCDC